jgi:hypothetical protein
MKKIVKIILLIFTIILIIAIFYVNYDAHFSKRAIKGKKVIENSKKIVIGMTEKELLNIMGQPDTIIKDTISIYYYDLNDDSYGSGTVYIDSTMRVKNKFFPNK